MSSMVHWLDDDRRILVIRYQDTIGYADMIAVNDEEARLLDSVKYPVSTIVDYEGVTHVPEAVLSNLPQLIVNAPRVNHPNARQVVVCHARPSIKLVYETILMVYVDLAERIRFAPNIHEAQAALERRG